MIACWVDDGFALSAFVTVDEFELIDEFEVDAFDDAPFEADLQVLGFWRVEETDNPALRQFVG